jgi:hypothetical protein
MISDVFTVILSCCKLSIFQVCIFEHVTLIDVLNIIE